MTSLAAGRVCLRLFSIHYTIPYTPASPQPTNPSLPPLAGTFVRPALSTFPRKPSDFSAFFWQFVRTKVSDLIARFALKWSSKPKVFARAQLKTSRSAIVLEAKALHRAMSEALAAGDTAALQRVCVDRLAMPLMSSIAQRPRGRRYGWELLGYTKAPLYPRVASHKLAKMGADRDMPIIEQAVVSIASRQRRVTYEDSGASAATQPGRVVPGSEREADLVEHVIVTRTINPLTWHAGEWRLFGTTKYTDPEDWKAEQEVLEQMTNPSAKLKL